MKKKVDDATLLSLVLTNNSQTQIAETLGMTKAAICRRIKSPTFQDLLADYRKRVLDGVLTALTSNAYRSVDTLVELLDDDNPYIRYQSASKILSLSQEFGVQYDLLRQIENIKQSQIYCDT